jgi:hypothetical protein
VYLKNGRNQTKFAHSTVFSLKMYSWLYHVDYYFYLLTISDFSNHQRKEQRTFGAANLEFLEKRSHFGGSSSIKKSFILKYKFGKRSNQESGLYKIGQMQKKNVEKFSNRVSKAENFVASKWFFFEGWPTRYSKNKNNNITDFWCMGKKL